MTKTKYGHNTVKPIVVKSYEHLLTEDHYNIEYSYKIAHKQIFRIESLGVNVKSQLFEQCVNTILYQIESKIPPKKCHSSHRIEKSKKEKIIYLRSEYDHQIEKMINLGIKVNELTFEECIDKIIWMLKNEVWSLRRENNLDTLLN